MAKFDKKEIVKKSQDPDRWYTDVILKGELADYAPVKGCMIIRPYGYEIWERIQAYLDAKFKELGVKNAYFPTFIPSSFLKKEKEHVEGFSPQLAIVTIGGGEKLKEPLVVRPTSETIMYDMYAKWIQSWRDLPLRINLWNNVVRWEKRTYLFLRTTEFLWQEGHTAHATFEEADIFARKILNIYEIFDQDILSVPVIVGKKSQSEKFPGAAITYALEALMPDGKALQMGTSHHLGDNFSKVFNIRYLDKSGKLQYVWQTSWAETTRVIGALILSHGDDQGLIFPPRIAPTQVVFVPIVQTPEVLSFCTTVKKELIQIGIRANVDDRESKSVGWKFNEWELKGIPLRIEVGQKELDTGKITLVRRDTGEKVTCQKSNIANEVKRLLDQIQKNLFDRMEKFKNDHTHNVDSYDKFKEIMSTKKGLLYTFWCEDPSCEAKIKEETKATTRVLPLDAKEEKGMCIYCGKPAIHRWYFAQAY